jgi:oligopeptide transport system substrate-binding protein
VLLVLVVSLAASCDAASNPPKQLAPEQTLRAVINAEPRSGGVSLDPAFVTAPVETTIVYNVFDGLYRLNDQLHVQPDIATGLPDVSADQMTYTFHIRGDAHFWNGARVTSADVLYSWNRAAALQGDWAPVVFSPVAGYDAVAAGKASALAGLSAPDEFTLVARLIAPTGSWLTELGTLPAAFVVNRSAVEAGGPDRWWTEPNNLVGTGPFRMTNWITNSELDFTAVTNWWGGPTGALTRLEVHIDSDVNARWKGYLDGKYDVLGFGGSDLGLHEGSQLTASLRGNPALRPELHTWSFGTSSWIGFNLQSGPFSGYGDGLLLRRAFAQAIDRVKLAKAICEDATICVPATGGLISKGLQGYLGDGVDPTAKFDPAAARATVKRLDPDGTRLRGLVFYYPVAANYDPTQAVAANLRAQWAANLGVDVTTRGLDPATFFPDMLAGRFTMWRGGWQADYDHPGDWFDNLFVFQGGCQAGPCNSAGAIYDRPGYTDLIASADKQALDQALSSYVKAGRMLVDDAALGALYSGVRTAMVKPYVLGYGANVLWEYRWKSLSIEQH